MGDMLGNYPSCLLSAVLRVLREDVTLLTRTVLSVALLSLSLLIVVNFTVSTFALGELAMRSSVFIQNPITLKKLGNFEE